MAVDTQLEGFEIAQKKLDNLGRKIDTIAEKALELAAKPILEEAKNIMALQSITGQLRAGLEMSDVRKKDGIRYRLIGVFAGGNKNRPFYAGLHEYGTSKERAQPFLGVAFEKRKKEAYTILKDQIKKELGL